jgi:hypothetical protein
MINKRFPLALAALILIVWPDLATANPVKDFGFLIGASSANRSFINNESTQTLQTDRVWGWAMGAHVGWFLPLHRLSLATEMIYMEKGYSREIAGRDEMSRDQYLSLPVLAVYQFSDKSFAPYAFGGPSAEALMSATDRYGRSLWNLGAHFGGGIRCGRFVDLQGRFSFDITEATGSSPSGLRGVKNEGFMLTVGIGSRR